MSQVLWLKCDDHAANKTVADASGNGHHGTAARNTNLMAATGKIGGALDFNGSDDIVNLGLDFIGTGACSIAAWVWLDSYGEPAGTGLGRIIDNGRLVFYVNEGAGNRNVKLTSNGGSNIASSAVDSVLLGSSVGWVHVSVTRTAAGTANFYVNGQLSGAANQASGTPLAATAYLAIGDRIAGDRAFDGRIDDLRIYDEVLSADQIKAIYNGGYGSDLAYPWKPIFRRNQGLRIGSRGVKV